MPRTIKGVYPTLRDNGTKRCSKCKKWLAISKFYKQLAGCGYKSECSPCANKRQQNNPNRAKYQREWKRSHPIASVITNNNGNSRRRGALETVTQLEFRGRCEDVAWICYICNLRIPKDKVSLDHIIPILNGGANHIDNILPTHRGCNFAKMNYSVKEVLSWRSA